MGALKADWVYPINVKRAWEHAITTDKIDERDLQYKVWEVRLVDKNEQVHTTLHISAF